jgi:hypothetical protein
VDPSRIAIGTTVGTNHEVAAVAVEAVHERGHARLARAGAGRAQQERGQLADLLPDPAVGVLVQPLVDAEDGTLDLLAEAGHAGHPTSQMLCIDLPPTSQIWL